jgi:hypothetical protein
MKCSEMGIPARNRIFHSLLFEDDQIIVAQDEDDMRCMMTRLTDEYKNGALALN